MTLLVIVWRPHEGDPLPFLTTADRIAERSRCRTATSRVEYPPLGASIHMTLPGSSAGTHDPTTRPGSASSALAWRCRGRLPSCTGWPGGAGRSRTATTRSRCSLAWPSRRCRSSSGASTSCPPSYGPGTGCLRRPPPRVDRVQPGSGRRGKDLSRLPGTDLCHGRRSLERRCRDAVVLVVRRCGGRRWSSAARSRSPGPERSLTSSTRRTAASRSRRGGGIAHAHAHGWATFRRRSRFGFGSWQISSPCTADDRHADQLAFNVVIVGGVVVRAPSASSATCASGARFSPARLSPTWSHVARAHR